MSVSSLVGRKGEAILLVPFGCFSFLKVNMLVSSFPSAGKSLLGFCPSLIPFVVLGLVTLPEAVGSFVTVCVLCLRPFLADGYTVCAIAGVGFCLLTGDHVTRSILLLNQVYES